MNRNRLRRMFAGVLSGVGGVTLESWQALPDLIHVGGDSNFAQTAQISAGYTTITPSYAVRQICQISQIRVNVGARDGSAWKFKLFRWNGSTYAFVAEQAFTPAATGVQTFTLSPLIDALPGDVVALYTPANNAFYYTNHALTIKMGSALGDITGNNAFTLTGGSDAIGIELFATRPYFALTGDSIAEGSGNGSITDRWYALADYGLSKSIPGSTTAKTPQPYRVNDPAYQLEQRITGLKTQNVSLSGEKWAWAASTGAPLAVATKARFICVLVGGNDVHNGVTSWATAEGHMDTVRALLADDQKLLVCEIPPRTDFTDGEAAECRTWNANYATWCAANDATLVPIHDALAQTRVSTGELDDLAAAYNQSDNVHLSSAGVAKLAELIDPYVLR